ncbi:MAG: 2-dehydropantoate 2-reductase [Anaerolineales bacterium]|nr:2-dehydropantoate 2-reductase [Anaerolineales bacterium]
MRICIYGAGAVGGYLGVQLALAGVDVSLIARGSHLSAMQQNGVKLLIGDEERVAYPRCTFDPTELGVQDVVIVCLKAPAWPKIVDSIQPLLGADTAVVTAVNGIPWWYFYQLDSPWRDHQLQSVDPGGLIWQKIGPERAIGCVVYPATEIVVPGVIKHISGNRFSLGEPSGERTERVKAVSHIMGQAGLKAPVRNHIRNDIWVKLWGNLSFNPVSALTGATLDVIIENPNTHALIRAMMLEGRAVGEELGVRFGLDVDQRIAGAAKVGAHKTSMLQDLERGRVIEIDALVTAVQEIGRLVNVATPTIDTVLALIQQRARLVGCY